jgi:prepilin-type N-terminal cleavage/methylation domain-containing protein
MILRMRARAARGFTLLEIAVALAILGVGIVTVLQIFGASLRLQDRATRETAAVREARTAMDRLLALPAEDFSEHGSSDEQRVTQEGLTTHSSSWLEKMDDRELELHPTHRLYHLQVTVTWQDGRGTKNYVLESLRMAPNNE